MSGKSVSAKMVLHLLFDIYIDTLNVTRCATLFVTMATNVPDRSSAFFQCSLALKVVAMQSSWIHKFLSSNRLMPNSSSRFEISVNTTDILVSVMNCSSSVFSARHLISSSRAMYDLCFVTFGV